VRIQWCSGQHVGREIWRSVVRGLALAIMSQKNVMLSLFTQVYESGTSNILLEVTLGWTSIPSRGGGEGQYSQLLRATENGLSCTMWFSLAPVQLNLLNMHCSISRVPVFIKLDKNVNIKAYYTRHRQRLFFSPSFTVHIQGRRVITNSRMVVPYFSNFTCST